VQPAFANETGDASPPYDLKVHLLPTDQRIEVLGTVSIPKSDSPRDFLQLVLNDTIRDFRVDVVEPTESAGGAKLEEKKADRGQARWTIRPSKSIQPMYLFSFNSLMPGARKDFKSYLLAALEVITEEICIGPHDARFSMRGRRAT